MLVKMTTLALPNLMAMIAPFSLLIAAIHTLNRLNSDSELIVLTASGAGYAQLADNFDAQWQAGNVPDLQAGLEKLDTNIDNQLQLGGQTP